MDENLNEKISQWIVKANNDLAIAEKDIKSEHPVTDAICFHSQQAAEKYLKLYLISHGIDPIKTHNIGKLLELCCKISSDFYELEIYMYLTEYAISLRYPDDYYIPSFEEAASALRDAKKVRDFVMKKLV